MLDKCNRLSDMQKVLVDHAAWPDDKEKLAELAAKKSSLVCVGSALALTNSFHDMVGSKLTQLPSSTLNSFIALEAFSEMKAFVNRQESLGAADIVQNFQTVRAFYAAVLPRVVSALESHSAGPVEQVKEKWSGEVFGYGDCGGS